MKTKLIFNEDINKQSVTLYHSKDIHISIELRKDHLEWKDSSGNPIHHQEYIVLRFPKSKNINVNDIRMKPNDRIATGFRVEEMENELEILFYNRGTFTWRVSELEHIGLLKVSQRIIPDWKEYGELFPCYINSKGLKEWSYNLVFGLIQMPFVLGKEHQRNKRDHSYE